eukprot:TRINITY_DN3098_c0_g5_i1.p1 TRINITY_DN3098_c0_g5~~TRINITY_DN3098_c0_g5_i1.p1  ORF type:complete len:777 (-),score=211.83 TRINITY_DN3098_c0_g5_i1:248-2578(-)
MWWSAEKNEAALAVYQSEEVQQQRAADLEAQKKAAEEARLAAEAAAEEAGGKKKKAAAPAAKKGKKGEEVVEEVEPEPEVLLDSDHHPIGHLRLDYEGYCQQFGLCPHPALRQAMRPPTPPPPPILRVVTYGPGCQDFASQLAKECNLVSISRQDLLDSNVNADSFDSYESAVMAAVSERLRGDDCAGGVVLTGIVNSRESAAQLAECLPGVNYIYTAPGNGDAELEEYVNALNTDMQACFSARASDAAPGVDGEEGEEGEAGTDSGQNTNDEEEGGGGDKSTRSDSNSNTGSGEGEGEGEGNTPAFVPMSITDLRERLEQVAAHYSAGPTPIRHLYPETIAGHVKVLHRIASGDDEVSAQDWPSNDPIPAVDVESKGAKGGKSKGKGGKDGASPRGAPAPDHKGGDSSDTDPATPKAVKIKEPHITNLAVSGWHVDMGTVSALTTAMQHSNTLTTLRLVHTQLAPSSIQQLCSALQPSAVSTLAIDQNPLTLEMAQALGALFAQESKLRIVSLRGNHLDGDSIVPIAQGLCENKTIVSLNVFDNNIGADGAKALAETILANTTLAHLSLGRNALGDEGAVTIAGALHRYPFNEEEIAARKVQEEEVARLRALKAERDAEEAEAKKKGKKSKGGKKNEDPIVIPELPQVETVAGVMYRAGNRVVSHVSLEYNHIGAVGATALTHMLAANHSIQHLGLAGNLLPADLINTVLETMQERDFPFIPPAPSPEPRPPTPPPEVVDEDKKGKGGKGKDKGKGKGKGKGKAGKDDKRKGKKK